MSKNILMIASECAPLAKTGGLADVVGALPLYLRQFGYDARVIMPYHRTVKLRYGEEVKHLRHFTVHMGWREQYVGLEQLELNGQIIYLIDNEYYFGDRIYRGGEGEIEQYAFFCRAVLEALPLPDFKPDLLHVHDWQAGIIPLLFPSAGIKLLTLAGKI